jgi:hypothetical protein
MEDRYSVLEKLRKRLVSLNLFTRASEELDILDKAMELFLEAETTPDGEVPALHDLQSECIHLQTMLNQCESSKDRLGARLRGYQSTERYFEVFNKRKIGIVGGHQTDAEKLKSAITELSKGAKIKFRETYDASTPDHRVFREKYRDVDIIIAFTGYTGHSMTKHVDMIEKEEGVSVVRLDKAPRDMEGLLLDIECMLGSK